MMVEADHNPVTNLQVYQPKPQANHTAWELEVFGPGKCHCTSIICVSAAEGSGTPDP